MSRCRIGATIIRRDRVSSTMDEARLLAESGAHEGTVIVAEHQTSGRGRAGRMWIDEPGNSLLLSVILRPEVARDSLSALPLLIGVAVAEALEQIAPITCQLKWPNDIWIDRRKVAGVLLTTHEIDGRLTVIVGIGINVNIPATRLPDDATSLSVASGTSVQRESLMEAVCRRLDTMYAVYAESGGVTDLSAWRNRAAMVGECVSIVQAGETLTGWYRGVDDDGALVLETSSCGRRRVVVGDLVRGPVFAH